MIATPFNDVIRLRSITEVVIELVQTRDAVIAMLAAELKTTRELVSFIRSLPRRDDDGVDRFAGERPRRLRLPAPDPTCVERAALYVAVAELIDPHPVRRLAVLITARGLHTFPLEDGTPVVLDPRVPQIPMEGVPCQS